MSVEYTFRHILGEVKKVFPGYWVIAGGAVRDTLRGETPKDWDIFLLDAREDDWCDVEDAFSREKWQPWSGHRVSEYTWLRLPVNTYRTSFGLCQLMLSKCKTMDDLLDTFDWNVSLFASDGIDTISRMEPLDIVPGALLRLNKLTYATSSMRRGFRFSERFGMHIHPDDMRLCIDGMRKEHSLLEAPAA